MFTPCHDRNSKLSEEIILFKLQLKLSSTITFGKQHFRQERCLRSEVWGGFWRLMAFGKITSSSCRYEQRSVCQTFPVPEQARVVAINLSHGPVQTQRWMVQCISRNRDSLLYKLKEGLIRIMPGVGCYWVHFLLLLPSLSQILWVLLNIMKNFCCRCFFKFFSPLFGSTFPFKVLQSRWGKQASAYTSIQYVGVWGRGRCEGLA